jgi:hypothetical protein
VLSLKVTSHVVSTNIGKQNSKPKKPDFSLIDANQEAGAEYGRSQGGFSNLLDWRIKPGIRKKLFHTVVLRG